MKTPKPHTLALPLLTLGLGTLTAQAATTPTPTPAPKVTAQSAQKMVARVLKETSEIRGLSIKRSVPSGVKAQAGIEKMVEEEMGKSLTGNQLAGMELVLKQLGLAKPDFNLKSYYVKMLGEQIAGYYDNDTKTFYTTDRVDPSLLETVMAHELTHALQDQHFDLSRLKNWPRHDSDAQIAMQSLVEGDATFTMSRYMSNSPMRMLGALTSSLKAQSSSQVLDNGPRALRESLTFPYVKGMMFAASLYRAGGFPAVSRAFTRIPQSTEQILHFEKYQSREAPITVPVRDLTPILGPKWTLLDHDVNGELDCQLILAQYIPQNDVVQRAAAGWGGNRYTIYRGPEKAALIVQDTVWDTEKDALEWRQAYAKRTTNRFKIDPTQRGALQVWNAAPNGVWMEQRGKRVLILEGTVGSFDVARVMVVLWR